MKDDFLVPTTAATVMKVPTLTLARVPVVATVLQYTAVTVTQDVDAQTSESVVPIRAVGDTSIDPKFMPCMVVIAPPERA